MGITIGKHEHKTEIHIYTNNGNLMIPVLQSGHGAQSSVKTGKSADDAGKQSAKPGQSADGDGAPPALEVESRTMAEVKKILGKPKKKEEIKPIDGPTMAKIVKLLDVPTIVEAIHLLDKENKVMVMKALDEPTMEKLMKNGTKVKRGPHWPDGDKCDGGAGGLGTVTGPQEGEPGWYWVKWDATGETWNYKMTDGCYPLEIVSVPDDPDVPNEKSSTCNIL